MCECRRREPQTDSAGLQSMDDRRGGRRECKVPASGNVGTRAAQVQQWHQVLHQTHSDWITGVTVRAKGREFPHLSTRIIAEFIDNQTRKKKSPPSGGQPRRLKTSTVRLKIVGFRFKRVLTLVKSAGLAVATTDFTEHKPGVTVFYLRIKDCEI